MHPTSVILGCFLWAQLTAAETPRGDQVVPSDQVDSPAAQGVVESAEDGRTPPEMVAHALALPDRATLAGRPLSLLEALSRAGNRSQQVEVTHAYWRLTMAVAEYHASLDEQEQLGELTAPPVEAAMLSAAQASAAAALRAAELAVLAAQHELAEAAALPAGDPLPLCADLPHVGPYRTYPDASPSVPSLAGRIRLIDRTLPIRRRAIDVRAAAVQAAENALQAAVDSFHLGETDLSTVLAQVALLGRQRRALLRTVCDYNRDIADYALAVVDPQISGQALVATLIMSPGDASRVEPATLNEPIPNGLESPARPSGANQPTAAPPRQIEPPAEAEEAMPRTPETPDAEAESAEPPMPRLPMVPVPTNRSRPTPRTANKPVLGADSDLPPASGLYPGLVDERPGVRAKQLAVTLHWHRSLPEPAGQPIDLRACLREATPADRRGLIEAYWLARQRAAEYQVLVTQSDFLEEVAALAPGHPAGTAESDEADRLRAPRLAVKADLLRAHVHVLESQFELTRRLHRPLESPWPLPATTPHSGPYLLKLEAQPPELVESWPLRRLAATIPVLAAGLEDRATAVVRADAARAQATAAYQAGAAPLDPVLTAIDRQTTETLAFLAALTDYNRAIADYVLTVLPPSVSADQLVKTLVIE